MGSGGDYNFGSKSAAWQDAAWADVIDQVEQANDEINVWQQLWFAKDTLNELGYKTVELQTGLGDKVKWRFKPAYLEHNFEEDTTWELNERNLRYGLNELAAGLVAGVLGTPAQLKDLSSDNTSYYTGALQFHSWLSESLGAAFDNIEVDSENFANEIILNDFLIPYEDRGTMNDPYSVAKEQLYSYLLQEDTGVSHLLRKFEGRKTSNGNRINMSVMDRLISAFAGTYDIASLPDFSQSNHGFVDNSTGAIVTRKVSKQRLPLIEPVTAGGITGLVMSSLSQSWVSDLPGIALASVNGVLIARDIAVRVLAKQRRLELDEVIRNHEIGHALSIEQGVGKARVGFLNYQLN